MKTQFQFFIILLMLIIAGCSSKRTISDGALNAIIADFDRTEIKDPLKQTFYPQWILEIDSNKSVSTIDVEIDHSNEEYEIVRFSKGDVFYDDADEYDYFPYALLELNGITYCLVDKDREPSDEVLKMLRERGLIERIVPGQMMWIECHVTVHYYFVCRKNEGEFVKRSSLDLMPVEDMPIGFCSK